MTKLNQVSEQSKQSKSRAKNICKLNIRYKEINIKQQAQLTYLGCVSNKSLFD